MKYRKVKPGDTVRVLRCGHGSLDEDCAHSGLVGKVQDIRRGDGVMYVIGKTWECPFVTLAMYETETRRGKNYRNPETGRFDTKDHFADVNKMIKMPELPKKLNNTQGVKMSSTVGGQRELIRQHRNKINELIDYCHALEKRLSELEGNV